MKIHVLSFRALVLITMTLLSLQSFSASDSGQIAGGTEKDSMEEPSFCGSDTKLVAVRKQSGRPHIVSLSWNGKDIKNITTQKFVQQPRCSKDGKKVAFLSYGESEKQSSIWTTNIDGSNLKRIAAPAGTGDSHPCWSPDGKTLAWTHGGRLVKMAVGGKDPSPLTANPAKATELCQGWSPDGSQLIYLRADTHDWSKGNPYQIWIAQATGGSEKSLGSGIAALSGKWSADGKFLYFNTGKAIVRINSTGSGSPQEIISWPNESSAFDISSDQKWIVFDNSEPYVDPAIFKKALKKQN